MKSYVITIRGHEDSERCADRCIAYGKNHGLHIEKHTAITPADDPVTIAKNIGIPVDNFHEKYSRFENCLAAFLSHLSLWKTCAERNNENFLIFEHDAVLLEDIPFGLNFKGVLSIGSPSYGKFVTPHLIGVNKLVSKQYMPGAHAYIVKPSAASKLVEKARTDAGPTDLFLSNKNFDFIEEFYPWLAIARDDFTSIQNENGCLAKHSYNENYRIL